MIVREWVKAFGETLLKDCPSRTAEFLTEKVKTLLSRSCGVPTASKIVSGSTKVVSDSPGLLDFPFEYAYFCGDLHNGHA